MKVTANRCLVDSVIKQCRGLFKQHKIRVRRTKFLFYNIDLDLGEELANLDLEPECEFVFKPHSGYVDWFTLGVDCDQYGNNHFWFMMVAIPQNWYISANGRFHYTELQLADPSSIPQLVQTIQEWVALQLYEQTNA